MKASNAGALYRLEQLSSGNTILHRLHPMAKLAGTVCFLVCVISLPLLRPGQLFGFVLIPAVLLALGEIPVGMILRRAAIALPFCLFAGIANVILDRTVLYTLGGLPVTAGLLSLVSILVRTLLCVSAVLILVALTPFSQLTGALRRLHVPALMVALLEMTYRYVGTLIGEAGRMSAAYSLRSGEQGGLRMGHMGSFIGMLLLRSYDRAGRIYQAMCCRGYGADWGGNALRPMTGGDWIGLAALCLAPIILRIVDVPGLLGRLLTCWM